MSASIAGLFVYPVKGCRGIALDSARVTERGLEYDREWMVVDAARQFLTQRTEPRLALIEPAVDATSLTLGASGVDPLRIALDHQGAAGPVTVWRDTVPGIDQGPEAARWLSDRLGGHYRLVRFDRAARRRCNAQYAGDSGAHTAFADGYPMLVLSQSSLDDLNARLTAPLPVNRFRPNLLLAGTETYDEDHIDELAIGEVRLKLVKPCTRCVVTTTDQITLERGVEPLRTLAGYRYNAALDGVAFGMNAIIASGVGKTVASGAPVEYSLRF